MSDYAHEEDMFSTEVPEVKDPPEFTLDPDQESAIDEIIENKNTHYFVTGPAGCGKSTVLKELKKYLKKSVVVCPTGMAAVNMGGQTLHSLFGIPPRMVTRGDAKVTDNEMKKRMLWFIKDIIIDEISMVRADVLDFLDEFLRLNCHRDKPFGGKRIIMFGDLDQLPPVVTDKDAEFISTLYKSPYFFSATSIRGCGMKVKYLHTIHRQKNDQGFITLLNAIKRNEITDEQINEINRRVTRNETNKLTITATNQVADFINREQLSKLPSEMFTYQASSNGDFNSTYVPAPVELKLKIGAQVVHLTNDSERGLVNGSRGVVVGLSDKSIVVKFTGKEEVTEIGRYTWENKKLKFVSHQQEITENVVGDFTQFPLKLGFASTTHKSQGQTFDEIHVDFGTSGAFASGMCYVALSRCRTLQGISLEVPITRKDIIIDVHVANFYRQMEETYGKRS